MSHPQGATLTPQGSSTIAGGQAQHDPRNRTAPHPFDPERVVERSDGVTPTAFQRHQIANHRRWGQPADDSKPYSSSYTEEEFHRALDPPEAFGGASLVRECIVARGLSTTVSRPVTFVLS